ncbi:hypothetical protein CDAR_568591 [Caerostris darwini]|uniref:Uncharacterized protein n=1 Tax=Caerostris darwini TaxID=1538125 RepID=A0AAV4VSI0_9ARAC|nr:hypothetical protein CDAR_568591 [Caerostris darwini]
MPEKLKPDLIFVLKSTVTLICKWFMDHSDILKTDFGDASSFQWRYYRRSKNCPRTHRRKDAPPPDNASSICIPAFSGGRGHEIADKRFTWHAFEKSCIGLFDLHLLDA